MARSTTFQPLREALAAEGYPFHSQTDTEVILALYAKYGSDCLQHLNGMFAFALWDAHAESLFIARDRIGKKPLYYNFIDGDIVFASELKALLTLPEIPRKVRLDALYDFFAYQYVPDPKTIFDGIFKLPPGHYLEVDSNGHHSTQYWDVSFAWRDDKSDEDVIQELRDTIASSTARRMIADVPLGAFLSGGVDSSGIVATMAHLSEQQGGKAITTCSIGFDNERFNETTFARQVAEQYHTDHHELTVHENVHDTLRHIVRYFDEPFADPSLVPTYFVSRLARQKVTVAIAGDGGDEVFAGYEKYSIDALENRLRERIPYWLRRALAPLAGPLSRSGLRPLRRAATLLNTLAHTPAMGFYLSNAQITDQEWQRITLPATRAGLGTYHPSTLTTAAYARCDGPDHLSRILYTDMKTYLPGDILVKVDRMSMANSLEVRAPLLDYELIEQAARLPSSIKFRDGEKKYVLKQAFARDLPDDILYRKKMGFSVPLADWLRGEIRDIAEAALLHSEAGLTDYFSRDAIRALWDAHQSGEQDHATLLWTMLMFQLWWEEYMTAPGAADEESLAA